jgi:type III restriction enzyme
MKLTFEADLPFQQDAIKSTTDLSEEQLLENLNTIQTNNEVKISMRLDGLNFSVEMETGTGDTYE